MNDSLNMISKSRNKMLLNKSNSNQSDKSSSKNATNVLGFPAEIMDQFD